ncbi:hypothetical protein FE257_012664 [Aspergillus nanangensis]|uniref:Arca-like protein n=1 Tax=Aspergillus nanangensis TaxID=2582783 RepID=A0AAD4CG56_ASPNN|nr:hypothetical protein FE257_012664 [Aspergillus nanangensis]
MCAGTADNGISNAMSLVHVYNVEGRKRTAFERPSFAMARVRDMTRLLREIKFGLAPTNAFIDQTLEIESYYLTDDTSDASDTFNPTAKSSTSLQSARSSNTRGASSTLVRSASHRSFEPPEVRPLELLSRPRNEREASPTCFSPLGDEQNTEHPLPIPFMNSNDRDSQSTSVDKSQSGSYFQHYYAGQPIPLGSENSCTPDPAAATVPSAYSPSSSIWKGQFFWPDASTTTQCICLVRYFVRELAPWFDVCDPGRHFTLAVPERARRCPPLLYAVFTVAAKHLVMTTKHRAPDGEITYKGISLPNLTANSAIEYHSACIAYLLEVSQYPEHVQDENLLAATVLLRYYEVLDTPAGGEDEERFLRTFQSFTTSQASENPHKNSFSYAAFEMALRLEIVSGFMKQRPVGLSFNIFAAQRSMDEADDIVWTHRLILHCADVLEFCFGDGDATGKARAARWAELKGFEDLWEYHMPLSFVSIKEQQPDPANGQFFPLIWYISDYQVLGMQYLDLARILLTVYDPSIPRIGPGSILAARQTATNVRTIVLRILGNAASNQDMIPAQIIAHVAIAACGHYFTDRNEQMSMVRLLRELEEIHAWPTAKTIGKLKVAWAQVNGEQDL